MQIKKRLRINVVISVFVALVICLVLFLSLYRLNKANNLAKIAGEIVVSVLERVTLRNDYIRNNTARAKEQWFAKHEQVSGLLKTASENFQDPEDRTNVAELVEDHESIGKIFSTITASREKRGVHPGSAELSRDVEDRLISQLNMRVYEVVLHSRKLLESSKEARDSALRLASVGIISVLLILIVVALVNSRTMTRAITDRVRRLREGAAVIGGGNLGHRIDVKGDDEFADLSNAFNAMTEKLRRSYNNLENEIEVRKRAEEKLQTAYGELEERVLERTQELKEAEAAMRLANAYNRSLIEASLDPLVTISAEGKITDVNAATEAATGCVRAALIGTDFSDYFTEPEKARAGYEQVFREGSVRDYALELQHRDGRVVPVLYNASVYHDGWGKVIGVFAAARDITEQKQAQKALSELTEAQEQRIIERTAELHAANETLRASRVAALNLMEDAVTARNQAEKIRDDLQREAIERKRAEDMLIALNKDLETRVFQRTRLYSLLAAVNSTIVRQLDQQALFNEVCRIIVETGGFKLAWVGLLDPESREVRPAASYGATGYLEGIRIIASDAPEGRGPTGMALVEGRHITNLDFEKSDAMKPWRERARTHGIRSSSAFPLRSGDQVIGALTIYSDQPSFFTVDEVALLLSLSENLSFAIAAFEVEKERHTAVDALRKLNEDLEQRVARRTAELEFSNRELEAFIYSVSHDLRAPLRHISGFTKIIVEEHADKLGEEGKEHLARIHSGAERMAHLIEDLLRLSRISRQEMEREDVDISAMVAAHVTEFREADPDRNLEVKIKDHISASADRRLIKLALRNLIDNAWKFTSKTQDARIEFDAFEQEGKIAYRFRDNGAGFDPAYAGKMFLPFHRLHTESEFEGSGIGLAIVERVIHRHGGRIWAEGEPGKGATVFFTLG